MSFASMSVDVLCLAEPIHSPAARVPSTRPKYPQGPIGDAPTAYYLAQSVDGVMADGARLVGAGSVEEIEIPESIHKSGGTKPKALIPAGLNQESYWARVAEIAKGKAGT